MSKYNQPIVIDLTKLGEVKYLVAAGNRLWLPKVVALGATVLTNPLDAVLQIRFSDEGGADVWAIKDGYRNTESGAFTQLLVTVLTQGAQTRMALMSGVDVGGGYASSDGLSPIIGLGALGGGLNGQTGSGSSQIVGTTGGGYRP